MTVSNGSAIATAEDFKHAMESLNVEPVELPKSGVLVRLCHPPIFAALEMARKGQELQAKITDPKPEDIKQEDIIAFTDWMVATLTKLFVEPRFSGAPKPGEIGLADILVEDAKWIFAWMRGEVVPTANHGSEDLASFPGGRGAADLPGRDSEAKPVQAE